MSTSSRDSKWRRLPTDITIPSNPSSHTPSAKGMNPFNRVAVNMASGTPTPANHTFLSTVDDLEKHSGRKSKKHAGIWKPSSASTPKPGPSKLMEEDAISDFSSPIREHGRPSIREEVGRVSSPDQLDCLDTSRFFRRNEDETPSRSTNKQDLLASKQQDVINLVSDGEEAGPSKAKGKPVTTVGKGGLVSARRAQFERPPELNFAKMNSQKNVQKKLKDRMRPAKATAQDALSNATPFKSKKAKEANGFAKTVVTRAHVDEMIHNDTLYRSSESEGSLMVAWSGKTVKVERGDERLAEVIITEEFECTMTSSEKAPKEFDKEVIVLRPSATNSTASAFALRWNSLSKEPADRRTSAKKFMQWFEKCAKHHTYVRDIEPPWSAAMKEVLRLPPTMSRTEQLAEVSSRKRKRTELELPPSSSSGPAESLPITSVPRYTPPVEPGSKNSSPPVETESKASSSSGRRSTRAGAQAKAKPPPINLEEVVLSYPFGEAGAVNVTNGDVARLEPGEFLNDTLIEFGLKHWHRELAKEQPELASQIHIFNSFFFKKLNQKSVEAGYESVKKWTNKFDIFQKKYIIVPINERLHWYLAIIYEPEHVLSPSVPLDMPKRQTRNTAQHEAAEGQAPLLPSAPDSPSENEWKEFQEVEKTLIIDDDTSSKPDDDVAQNKPTNGDVDDQPRTPRSKPKDGRRSPSQSSDSSTGTLQYVNSPATAREVPTLHPPQPMDSGINSPKPEDEVEPQPEARTPPISVHSSDMEPAPSPIIVDPPPVKQVSANEPTSVSPAQFYAPMKAQRRRQSSPFVITRPTHPEPSTNLGSPMNIDEDEEVPTFFTTSSKPPSPTSETHEAVLASGTHIFTFDSLGTNHNAVVKKLATYLQMEAKHKKGVENPTMANGRSAIVPVQPNFCDCGVYLLHFASVFMQDPSKFCSIILESPLKPSKVPNAERQRIWDDKEVQFKRANLKAEILSLMDSWKESKAKKLQEDTAAKPEVVDSDGSVDIIETKTVTPGRKKKRRAR